MKNILKAIIIFGIITTITCIPSFATSINENSAQYTNSNKALTADEYKEKATIIRAEINTYTEQIKSLREYNSKVNAKLKELNEKRKTDKNVISNDTMKKIKELRKSIKSTEKKETTITEDNSIKALVKNKEYDKAIDRLNAILEEKKVQLEKVKERNQVWQQIDALIS